MFLYLKWRINQLLQNSENPFHIQPVNIKVNKPYTANTCMFRFITIHHQGTWNYKINLLPSYSLCCIQLSPSSFLISRREFHLRSIRLRVLASKVTNTFMYWIIIPVTHSDWFCAIFDYALSLCTSSYHICTCLDLLFYFFSGNC
jgi:hypothetical protein